VDSVESRERVIERLRERLAGSSSEEVKVYVDDEDDGCWLLWKKSRAGYGSCANAWSSVPDFDSPSVADLSHAWTLQTGCEVCRTRAKTCDSHGRESNLQ